MRAALPVMLALLCSACASQPPGANITEVDFRDAVQQRLSAYEGYDVERDQDLMRGDPEASIDALLARHTPHDAVDDFIIGNFLYDQDPDLAMRYHRKAWKALPQLSRTTLEMAYAWHRQGNCRKALPLYQQLDSDGLLGEPQYALMAHCYLRQGDYKAAIDSWVNTDFPHQHTAVDFAIFDVFGPLSPERRFADLLIAIRNGDEASIGPALELAKNWDRDWWNSDSNAQAFTVAMDAMKKRWGADTVTGHDVRLIAEADALDGKQAVRDWLQEKQLILPGYGLPKTGYATFFLVSIAIHAQVLDAQSLKDRFFDELYRRSQKPDEDPWALDLLAYTLVQLKDYPQLEKIDQLGWKRYHKVNYAISYLIDQRQLHDKWPAWDDPLYDELIDDFPAEPYFHIRRYIMALQENQQTTALLANIVEAEYHGLRSNKQRYSSDLDTYWQRLYRMTTETSQEDDAASP